jgi:hypothetical protein
MVALAAMLLSGCATDTGRMAQAMFQSAWGTEGVRITREQAADVPYASLGAQVGDGGNQGLLVLGTNTGTQAEWYSGDLVMIRTRAGRIVRTAGLPYDLGGLEVRPVNGAAAQRGATVSLFFDFPDYGVFGAIGTCTERDAGPEIVTILGTQISTRRYIEDCEVESLDWAFDNEFWKDPATGYVWRSRQSIHPRSAPITIEVFRPELPPET